jgi:hypothetical protein
MKEHSIHNKCLQLQWTLDDIDWDAPGKEQVTADQSSRLREFMADTAWIEYIASLVFERLAADEQDPVLSQIYWSFAVDERRHFQAELRLMERWGMVRKGERPRPNQNAIKLIRALEYTTQFISPSVLAAIIPLTELVLDGAMIKYLTAVITDPLCGKVLNKINSDEARHLAVDYLVLERYGREHSWFRNCADIVAAMAHPVAIYSMYLGYIPMVSRTRKTIVRAGLDIEDLRKCMRTYMDLGTIRPDIAKHPCYQIMKSLVQFVHAGHSEIGDFLVTMSDTIDKVTYAMPFQSQHDPFDNIGHRHLNCPEDVTRRLPRDRSPCEVAK